MENVFMISEFENMINLRKEDSSTVVLFLHGLGGVGSKYVGMFISEESPFPQNCRILIPQAKEMDLEVKQRTLTSWFDYAEHQTSKPESLKELLDYLKTLINKVRMQFKPEKLFITGHSQGGVSCLSCLQIENLEVDGIISFSGYRDKTAVYCSSNKNIPVLLCHSKADETVKYEEMLEGTKEYRDSGWNFEIFEFEGTHSLSANCSQKTKEFISKLS